MSQYPWLREKKIESMMNKKKKTQDYTSPHAGLNRDILYTGNGNPKEVADIAPNGQPIHKGELKFNSPGNGDVITDALSSRELMSNPVIAGRIGNQPGFRRGGYYNRKGYELGGFAEEPTLTRDNATANGVLPNPVGTTEGEVAPVQSRLQDIQRNVPEPGAQPTGVSPNIIAPNTNVPVSPTIDADMLRKKGLSSIENILSKGSISGNVAGQKQLSDLKSTQDVERQVLKQEQAQKGMGSDQAGGQLARLTGSQQGQLAETEANIGIEQLRAQERAAGTLAGEGKVQSDIDIARSVQGLNEAQFGEFIRQFDVGTGQWSSAFEERRRQFDVGSEQWQSSFDEQRKQYDKNFQENVRQFDVGSDQWEQAFNDNRDFKWKSFDEQKRQFEVGSEQWEKANQQQLDQWKTGFDEQRRQFDTGTDQWNKSFDEERKRYDNEDNRWWASFNEQREQFETGTEQWQQSFDQQKHQFDVGSEQWDKVHDLQVKEFAQQVDMNKHTVDVWKDNVDHRDKAYLDSRSDAEQRLEMERAVHEKNMDVLDFQIDAAENNAVSQAYWENSERMYNYASTHLDGYNEKTKEFQWDAEQEMFKWLKAKYPNSPADKYTTPAEYKEANPAMYKSFKQWAAGEWKAATDGRLTNPYDKMLYDVESSDLDDKAKKAMKKILTSPESLAGIAGVEYDPKTKTIKIVPKPPNPDVTVTKKKETPGPVGPGPDGPGPIEQGQGPEGIVT
ncbi:MAG TPA: hypothetical protein VMV77_09320 [Bacteroidales bacterium]|nr:hypothetical protein [Bacteroidales bacterium]